MSDGIMAFPCLLWAWDKEVDEPTSLVPYLGLC